MPYRRRSKLPGFFPPSDGVIQHVHFDGMQDSGLTVNEDNPIWEQIEKERAQEELITGSLEIDIDNLPDLLTSSHEDASIVLAALYRLGAYH